MLKLDILVLKKCLNEIFLLQQYSNEIKLLSFVENHSALAISPIFNFNRENIPGPVQDFNRTKNYLSAPLN
jgi:hypothetical protein